MKAAHPYLFFLINFKKQIIPEGLSGGGVIAMFWRATTYLAGICFLLGTGSMLMFRLFSKQNDQVFIATDVVDPPPQRSAFHGILTLPKHFVARKLSAVRNVPIKGSLEFFKVVGPGCVTSLQFSVTPAYGVKDASCSQWDAFHNELEIRIDGEVVVRDAFFRIFGLYHKLNESAYEEIVMADIQNHLFSITRNGCLKFNVPMVFETKLSVTIFDTSSYPQGICVWSFLEFQQYKSGELLEKKRLKIKHSSDVIDHAIEAMYVKGSGNLLGVTVGATDRTNFRGKHDNMVHTGGETIILDVLDEERVSVMHGIGGEDFWHDTCNTRRSFSHLTHGVIYLKDATRPRRAVVDPLAFSAYRNFVQTPYPFTSFCSVHVAVREQSSWDATAFWYQDAALAVTEHVKHFPMFSLKVENPLHSVEEFREMSLTELSQILASSQVPTVVMRDSFADITRIVADQQRFGNQKWPEIGSVVVWSKNFFESVCEFCCVRLQILVDDAVFVYIDNKKVYADANVSFGFSWKPVSNLVKVTKESSVTLKMLNTRNLNFFCFAFGLKITQSNESC
jgi:hypothetical protein